MAKSRSDIIGDIEAYIGRNGARFGEWYVGVTGGPKATLFKAHKVKEKGDAWVVRLAKDEYESRDIAEYFITTRGTKGAVGSGRDTDLYVYAYKRKPYTKP
ncbi:MAG: hypothetical protein M0006_09420 [Magnetospirillum sp.]|nr:hypothetical protein [Magnetospirillum sp.]